MEGKKGEGRDKTLAVAESTVANGGSPNSHIAASPVFVAEVVELEDTLVLGTSGRKLPCGSEPRPRHTYILLSKCGS